MINYTQFEIGIYIVIQVILILIQVSLIKIFIKLDKREKHV